MSDLAEKLKTEVEQADWDMLIPHYEKGTVLLLDASIELIQAGVAVAEDQTQLVALWLQEKKLRKADEHDDKAYSKDRFEKRFKFLIIQPYVIVQESL